MAKSKKSKILAMALCASVMTGIYASPVMAAELYENAAHQVTTNGGTKITELEGLKEITLGNSVKITTDGKGIIRVGDVNGVNTRVHNDGFYINKTGHDQKTSLTAGTLTLAGKELTFEQLANINSVIGENGVIKAADGSTVGGVKMKAGKVSGTGFFVKDSGNALDTTGLKLGDEYLDKTKLGAINDVITNDGVVESKGDVTSKADGTTTYSLNNVGKNTSGITRDIEGKVTTIEGAFSVDKKGHIYNANRSFQVTKDGAARFGNKYDDHIRMDDGVLSVKTDQNTTVARVSKDGFYVYKDNGKFVIGEDSATYLAKEELKLGAEDGQTLTADKLSTINSVITDNGEVVSQGDVTSTYTKEDGSEGHYYLNKVGADLDALETNVGNISGNVAGIKRNAGAAYGEGRTEIEGFVGVNGKDGRFYVLGEDGRTQAAVITNDGTARFGDYNNANVRMENGVLSINEGTNAVASLSKDGLILSDSENVKHTLTAAKIADIQHIEHEGNATVIEGATSFTTNGMETNSITATSGNIGGVEIAGGLVDGVNMDDLGGIKRTGTGEPGTQTTTIEGVTSFNSDGMTTTTVTTSEIGVGGSGFYANSTGITVGNGRFSVDSGTGNLAISNGTVPVFQVNGKTGQVNIGANGGSQTVITGNSITTETLNVEKIVLGDKIVDKETGDVISGELEIGADGSIKIADKFEVDTDNLAAHYGNTSLNMDSDGFNLNYGTGENAASLVLNGSGFAFDGPVHLGDGTQVKFSHNGNDISLSSLVNRVENLEQKTTGISFDESNGSTTIKDMNKVDGEWNEGDSSVTVGDNGTTFEGTGVGTTNINGGKVTVNGNDSTVTTIDGSEIVSDATASSTVTGGAGAGTGTVNGGYAEFDKGEGDKTIVDGGNVNVSNKITVGTGTTEITGDHVIVGVHDANKSNIGKGEATFDKGEDGKTIVNGGNVTTGNITADTGKIGNVEFTADGTTFEDGSENQTVIDKNGIVVGANDGTKIDKDDVSINDKNGGRIHLSDMGQVDNIDAELKQNGNYDETVVGGINAEADIRRAEVNRLDNRISKVEDRVDKVGAMSAAIANLRTMSYDPAAPTEIAVGVGQYRSETGVALGMFHYPNRDFMLSLSVSTSGDEVMGGIGATWKFGRKSPEKVAEIKKAQAEADVRRAEAAKLAKAEEMKQAAKEAKIKAQQERHAKLAAERAAQAEAAK